MAILLPPSENITSSGTQQGGAKVYHAAVRTFLAALFGTDAENKPAARAALGAQAASDVLSGIAAGTTGTSFKNILTNPRVSKGINQRAVANWASVAIGAYGYDRWKKVDNSNILQIVEDGNYEYSSVYTLSGVGVTKQQVTSPASGHWTIPSIPITATYVQLEIGSIATQFENRPIGLELSLCQRYYNVASTYVYTGSLQGSFYSFPVRMRASPSVVGTGGGFFTSMVSQDSWAGVQTVTGVSTITFAAEL